MSQRITIGSRGSDLALWQAHYTKDRLESAGYVVDIRIIKTKGDRIQHLSFDKMEGKGFFTKELEDVLLEGTIDLAVHSYKDLPSLQPAGLLIAGISDRAHPADVLLVPKHVTDPTQSFHLPYAAVVGTSSARRKSQLLLFRPDVQIKDIRGNVPTRIQKLRNGQFDAILMAKAGLDRINVDLSGLYVHIFDPTQFVPAPAQGVLAFQIRETDERARKAIQQITSTTAATINQIERETLRILEGGCQIPLGIFAREQDDTYHVWCSYSHSWNGVPHRLHVTGCDPTTLPKRVVENIKQSIVRSIFISREQTGKSLFTRLMQQRGCTVTGKSLIDFSMVPIKSLPSADIYCFASRNAVRYLHEQHTEPPAKVLWAIGEGTAATMRELGWVPDFVGNGEADYLAEKLQEFKPEKVVFPTAKQSRSSIQEALGKSIVWEDLVVYDNRPKQKVAFPPIDIAVLTSPQNAEVFVKQYAQDALPKLVAIGQPTYTRLSALTKAQINIAYTPSELSLADEVSALLF